MNDKKMDELREMARPLHAWLQDNYHLHAAIIIDYDGVKVVEVNMFHPIKTENDEG